MQMIVQTLIFLVERIFEIEEGLVQATQDRKRQCLEAELKTLEGRVTWEIHQLSRENKVRLVEYFSWLGQ